MRLLSEVLGALFAGVLILLVARRFGFRPRAAVGALALVPIAVAALLALPALRDGVQTFRDSYRVNHPLTSAQAQLQPGASVGVNVDFFSWAGAQMPEGDSFHLVIGEIPDEVYVDGVGVRQAAILQWGMFQLAPRLAVEQSPKARNIAPDEGRRADWIVFYESDPAQFAVPLDEAITYAPGFAIARSRDAG